MVHETVQGAFRQTNLTNESAEYLAKREELRLAEIELMRQRERVADLRRQLPPGPVLEDYTFIEGPIDPDSSDTPTRTVRLSELFTAVGRPLVIYHLMYGKRQTKPCPMCTAAIWYTGIKKTYYGNVRTDFAALGRDTGSVVEQVRLPIEQRARPHERLLPDEARRVLDEWKSLPQFTVAMQRRP